MALPWPRVRFSLRATHDVRQLLAQCDHWDVWLYCLFAALHWNNTCISQLEMLKIKSTCSEIFQSVYITYKQRVYECTTVYRSGTDGPCCIFARQTTARTTTTRTTRCLFLRAVVSAIWRYCPLAHLFLHVDFICITYNQCSQINDDERSVAIGIRWM